MRELELKVELSKSDVDRLAGEFAAGDLGIGPAATKELRTVYFDTPDHDLRVAGVSLRLRRQDGGWLQTVKVDQHIEGGVSNPIELETFVEEERPDVGKIADKKVRRVVEKAVLGTSLRAVFETVVQRTTRNIKVQDSEIELAVDNGEVRAGHQRQDLREAELELKAGSGEDLLLAAERLLAGHELKLSTQSKAERGYRLALGKKGGSTEPETQRASRARIAAGRRFPPCLTLRSGKFRSTAAPSLRPTIPKPPTSSGSDYAACAARFVSCAPLSTAPHCVPSSAARVTWAAASAGCAMPTCSSQGFTRRSRRQDWVFRTARGLGAQPRGHERLMSGRCSAGHNGPSCSST